MKDMTGIGGNPDGQVDGADGTVGTVGIGIGIGLNGDGMVGVGVGTGIVGSHGATGVDMVDMVDGEVDGEMVGEMDGLGNHQVGPTGPTGPIGPIGPGLGILMPRMHSLNSMAPGGQVNRSNLKQVMKSDGNLKLRRSWKMRRARRRIRPDASVGMCAVRTSLTAVFLILKQ